MWYTRSVYTGLDRLVKGQISIKKMPTTWAFSSLRRGEFVLKAFLNDLNRYFMTKNIF